MALFNYQISNIFSHFLASKNCYTSNDTIRIKEQNDDNSFGTIIRIWKDASKPQAYANIRWFYKPAEIFQGIHEFLSTAELFDSNNYQDIPVESIYDKIQVLNLDEYHKLDEIDDDIFFTRAVYNIRTKEILPPLSEWKKVCFCKKIINPDHLYLACDKCNDFFHQECVGSEIERDKEWLCKACKV